MTREGCVSQSVGRVPLAACQSVLGGTGENFLLGGRWGRGEDNTKHSESHGEDGTFLANPSCLPLPPGSHSWCCSVPRGFPAPLPQSPFYPPDLDRRVDSPALSGRGSRPSGRDEACLTTTFQTWPRGWFHIPKDPDFPVPS